MDKRMKNDKWTVRSSSYQVRSPWLSVRADDCETSTGIKIAPYYVLEFPDFVHVLAMTDDHIVLVRQYRHGAGNWSLELPGGVMDQGESDPIQAAIRELSEETGFQGGEWSYVMPLSVDPARCANRLHFVRALGVSPGIANPEPCENIETILVSREEAVDLAKSGAIANAAHVGMLLIGLA